MRKGVKKYIYICIMDNKKKLKNNSYNYVCNNILKNYHICINKTDNKNSTDIVNKCNKIKINLKIYCNEFISK